MDWTDGPGTVAAVVAVLAMIGSFIGFVRTIGKERSAGRAAERAEAAEQRANEARDRAAAALEALVEAQKPQPVVQWSEPIQDRGKQHYVVRNLGNAVAREVLLTKADGAMLVPDEEQPLDVDPQTGLGFVAVRTMGGGTPTVRITWVDPEGTKQETLRRV